eukprot:Selendium_serpulae@DN2706_c0_g1_i3.p1
MPLFHPFVPADVRLPEYKYSASGSTPGDKALNPMWEAISCWMPQWVPPNVITLVGLFGVLGAFGIAMWCSPTLNEPFPRIWSAAIAFLLFVYQTLDSVDGKQARRTGSSSQLGQLFDHGCDIIAATLFVWTVFAVCGCGTGLLPFLTCAISTQLHQFMYMWAEYRTHVFYCSTGVVGVTEAQLGGMGCCVMLVLFGADFFSIKPLTILPLLPETVAALPLRNLLMKWLCVMNAGIAIYFIIRRVLSKLSVREAVPAAAEFASFVLFVFAEWVFYNTAIQLMSLPAILCFVTIMTIYSIILMRLLLAACCKFYYPSFHLPSVPFFVQNIKRSLQIRCFHIKVKQPAPGLSKSPTAKEGMTTDTTIGQTDGEDRRQGVDRRENGKTD